MFTIILKLSNAHTSLKLYPLTARLFFLPLGLHLNNVNLIVPMMFHENYQCIWERRFLNICQFFSHFVPLMGPPKGPALFI